MPQLPTSTAEEYGAEDEIMRFNQEEDECSDTSTVDVVNDIKDDLLNEDDPESGKSGEDHMYRNHSSSGRYGKDTNHGGMYGSPAAVIVGPHRYYDHPSYRSGSNGSHAHPQNHPNYPSGSQIRVPMYQRDERSYYEHGAWPPTQVGMPTHYSSMYHGGRLPSNYGRYGPGIPPGVPYYGPGHGYPMPGRPPKEQKRPHVKKPLNAFMLFMKEQRPKIAAEFTLKESAAINQILGKRWHALDKSEQAKYYELARKERAIHMQLYPGWSARDNYAQIGRKKKRPRDKNEEMNPKKCRARYGLDRQEQWCKPCRRKKKCIRFLVGADGETTEVKEPGENSDSDDNHENKPQHTDTKEKLHELVSMVPKDSTILNNNNNNSSISTSISSSNQQQQQQQQHFSSSTTSSSSTSSQHQHALTDSLPSTFSYSSSSSMDVISSGLSLALNTPPTTNSSLLTSRTTSYAPSTHSLSNILTGKPIDSSQLKTISASCS